MVQCHFPGCLVSSPSKMKKNGYCTKHASKANKPPSATTPEENSALTQRIVDLEAENETLKFTVKQLCQAVDDIHGILNDHRSVINTVSYEKDGLEQYGRKESFRLIDVPEEKLELDDAGNVVDSEDCAQLIIDAAANIDVDIAKKDIQRVHRIGKRKKPSVDKKSGKLITPKPRPVIVRLKDYNQRQSVIKNKRAFQDNAKANNIKKFENAFVVEDLTPLRSKLLWYAKKRCNNRFSKCHTKDGKILAQTSACKPHEWVTLSTPDDFFKHGIDLDIDIVNDRLHRVKILKHLDFPVYTDLLE